MEGQIGGMNFRSLLLAIFLAALIARSAPDNATVTDTTTSAVTDTTHSAVPNSTNQANTDTTTTSSPTTSGNTTIIIDETTSAPSVTTMMTNVPGSTEAQAGGTTKARPVSDDCLKNYINCTQSKAANESANFEYCEAFNKSMTCIKDTSLCSSDDTFRLQFLDCEPYNLFDAVTPDIEVSCQARITVCLSQTEAAKNIKASDVFQTFFCKVQEKSCLTMTDDTKYKTKACSEAAYKSALKAAQCSSAYSWIPSAMLICLTLLAQRLVKD